MSGIGDTCRVAESRAAQQLSIQVVSDEWFRPHSAIWTDQVAEPLSISFLEEWQRKYPAESERELLQRSWRHCHADLPSREAYWLIGCMPSAVPDGTSSVCAVTGLLLFRKSVRSRVPPTTSSPRFDGVDEST
jgi:hypothetical protein